MSSQLRVLPSPDIEKDKQLLPWNPFPSKLPELLYLAVHLMKKDKNSMRSIASLIDQIAPPVLRFCQIKLNV